MIWTLIIAFLSTQTLAPPPINFTSEIVQVDGKRYWVQFRNNRITIEDDPGWMKRLERRAMIRYARGEESRRNDEDGNGRGYRDNRPDNVIDRGCLWGCLIVVGFSGAFWATIYLIWRNWPW